MSDLFVKDDKDQSLQTVKLPSNVYQIVDHPISKTINLNSNHIVIVSCSTQEMHQPLATLKNKINQIKILLNG